MYLVSLYYYFNIVEEVKIVLNIVIFGNTEKHQIWLDTTSTISILVCYSNLYYLSFRFFTFSFYMVHFSAP